MGLAQVLALELLSVPIANFSINPTTRFVLTEALYTTDSYLQEFSATITHLDDEANAIVLDRTAFFPGGGGQPCDRGEVRIQGASLAVEKLSCKGETIYHHLAGDLPEVGTLIQGQINWQHRYQLMRTHSALHVLCGVIWRDYQAQVTGGKMEPLKGRLDFEFESLSVEFVREIEAKINLEVQAARPVSVQILERLEAFKIPDLIRTKVNLLPDSLEVIRVVNIKGLDLQADGGTHVANTREIGAIKIVKHKSKGKINKRLEIALAESC